MHVTGADAEIGSHMRMVMRQHMTVSALLKAPPASHLDTLLGSDTFGLASSDPTRAGSSAPSIPRR